MPGEIGSRFGQRGARVVCTRAAIGKHAGACRGCFWRTAEIEFDRASKDRHACACAARQGGREGMRVRRKGRGRGVQRNLRHRPPGTLSPCSAFADCNPWRLTTHTVQHACLSDKCILLLIGNIFSGNKLKPPGAERRSRRRLFPGGENMGNSPRDKPEKLVRWEREQQDRGAGASASQRI